MRPFYFVLAGVVFGMANIIPGVSGGTMAVVFGVYERLIGILADVRHNLKKEWKFLVTFGLGLVLGILGFGKLMNWALTNYPSQAKMFFVGVILGSLPMLIKSAFLPGGRGSRPAFKLQTILPFLIAFACMIPMALSGDSQAAKEAAKAAGAGAAGVSVLTMLLMAVYGVVAASTMIIPGISGSFVMLLLGVYGTLIAAVAGLTPIGAGTLEAVKVLLPFGIGVVIGLIYCSKLIRFLLRRYPAATYSAILGFVLGSVWCVFPGFGQVDIAGVVCLIAGVAVLWACERLSPEGAGKKKESK